MMNRYIDGSEFQLTLLNSNSHIPPPPTSKRLMHGEEMYLLLKTKMSKLMNNLIKRACCLRR